METFILVHGARHGGWCWDKVVPILERAGHKTVAVDLPGYGKNASQANTLEGFVNCLTEVLDRQPEPVILVGHSMGGVVISQAAEYRPGKIKKLVYICAFLLRDGETIKSRGGGNLKLDTEEALRKTFYEDCSDEDFQWAKAQLSAAPGQAAQVPVHLTAGNYGRVPRVYIECLRDNAIPPLNQKAMYTDTPCERIITMDTSHSPFLAKPEEFAANLLSIVTA